jgi:hypothetical protein
MNSISRRSVVRLAGGVTGVSGVLGAGLLSPAAAAPGLPIGLDSSVVDLDDFETLILRVAVDPREVRRLWVLDTTGVVWTRQPDAGYGRQVWTAVPSQPGWGHVVVAVTGLDDEYRYVGLDFQVIGTPTAAPVVGTGPTRTMFGACPTEGTSPSSVVSKYGSGASIRRFVPGDLGTVARPAGVSKMHVSWKPDIGSTLYDAELVSSFANLEDGDLVEVWHESDVKYRKGGDLAGMLAMKNQLHDRVVALRDAGRIPKVLTVNSWAGWSVDSTSSVNPANLHARADILGIDMDGIPEADSFYPYAARQMGTKFIEAYRAGGYKGWTVPEFTMPSVDVDPTSTKRIAWFQAETATISQGVPAAGIPVPHMIAWFDTAGIIGESEKLSAANEIAAWSTLVAGNV